MASLTITPAGPLQGTIAVPGDKSITHRAIILSALAEGDSVISAYCRGEDCLNTMRAFQAMGIQIEERPEQLRVRGKGLWGLTEPRQPLDCGNSGTGIRLLTGLLAGQDFFSTLTGDESIRRRPMGRIVKPLREMGAKIAKHNGAKEISFFVVHNDFSPNTYARINPLLQDGTIDRIYTLGTLPMLPDEAWHKNLIILSPAKLIADVISRIHCEGHMRDLFIEL